MAQKIKNKQSIIEAMDEFLAMFKFERNKMEQNTNMTKEETEQICDLCYRLKEDGKTVAEYEKLYEECRKKINDLLKAKNYQPVNPSKNSNKVVGGITRIPQIMKLLIYYMAYRAFELYDAVPNKKNSKYKKPSQNDILDFIGYVRLDADGKKIKVKKANGKGYQYQYDGYRLSDKTFTYLGVSPNVYCDMNNYRQIELPSSYAGAKVFYLGYCINWLTACAGTYDIFLDLFGGSASASMAVNQLDTSDYYINEYDFFNVNYYNVIADDKLFEEYISELKEIVKKLTSSEYGVSSAKDFFGKCEEKAKAWREKYSTNNPQEWVEENITQGNYQQYAQESDEEKVAAALAFTFMQSFQTTGGSCDKGAINETKLQRFCRLSIDEYKLFHKKMKRIKEFYNCDALGNTEFIIEYLTDKAPTRYKKVETLSKDIRSGKKKYQDCSDDEKKLLRLLGGTEKKEPRPFRTLIYSDSPYLETAGYKAGGIDDVTMRTLIERLVTASLKGSHFIFSCRAGKSIENDTYTKIEDVTRRVIDNFRRENGQIELEYNEIYTDNGHYENPPNDEFADVWKPAKAKPTMHVILDLLTGNHAIYENVFKEFEKNKKEDRLSECQVLVCINEKDIDEINKKDKDETNKKDTEELNKEKLSEKELKDYLKKITEEKVVALLKKAYVMEVFITDFDFIVPNRYKYTQSKKVKQDTKSKQDFTFAKYGISEFCKLLDKYMFKSNRVQSVTVKKIGDGYTFQQGK